MIQSLIKRTLMVHFHDRKADIALIGLAVMGQNLILNMDSKGFVVCAYNRTVDKVSDNSIFLKIASKISFELEQNFC